MRFGCEFPGVLRFGHLGLSPYMVQSLKGRGVVWQRRCVAMMPSLSFGSGACHLQLTVELLSSIA